MNERPAMQHLNGNILCALDVETTGLVPGHHEIFELAMIVLDGNFKPDRKFTPLNITIQPRFPERIDWSAPVMQGNKGRLKRAQAEGLTYDASLNLINRWFDGLNLLGKRLAPVTQNGIFDLPFIRDFVRPLTFEDMFATNELRDTMYFARSMNDLADIKGWPYVFEKVDLGYLCLCMGIDRNKYGSTHTAWVDALLTADVYAAQQEWMRVHTIQ